MPQEEFESLMSGEKVYSSAWETALMACESLHLISENLKTMEKLNQRNDKVTSSVDVLNKDFDRLKVSLKSTSTKLEIFLKSNLRVSNRMNCHVKLLKF